MVTLARVAAHDLPTRGYAIGDGSGDLPALIRAHGLTTRLELG